MIECQCFCGHHIAENIWQYYYEAIAPHGISEKIVTTITDNASNVVKAIKLPGFSKENDDQPESESELSSEDEDSVVNVEPVDIEEAGLEFLPEHDTCFAHTLQLVVKDGFKEAGSLNKVLENAGKIVTYVRKSMNSSDLLEGEKKLQAKVATQWNSELCSIKSILSIPEDKLLQLDTAHLTRYE